MSFNLTKQQRIAILNEVTILTGVKPTTNSLKNDVGFFIFLIRVFSNNDNIIINEPAVPNTDGIGTTGNGSAVDLGGDVGTVAEPNNPEIGLPRSNSITFTDGASEVLFKIEQNISGQGIISSVAFSINLTPTNFKVSPPSSNTDFNVDGNSIDQTADRLTFTVPDSGEGSVSLRMLSDSSSARFEYVVPPSEFTGNIVPTSEHVNSTLGQKSVSNALRAVDGDDINKVITNLYNYPHQILYYGKRNMNSLKSIINQYHKVNKNFNRSKFLIIEICKLIILEIKNHISTEDY